MPTTKVQVRVVGPNRLELEVERPMTLEEAFDRWESVLPVPDWNTAREEAAAELADEFLRKETGPASRSLTRRSSFTPRR